MASTQDGSLFKFPPELRNKIWNECAVNGSWFNLIQCSKKIKDELAPMCSRPSGPIDRIEFIIYAGEKSQRIGDVRVTWTEKTITDGEEKTKKIVLGLSVKELRQGMHKDHLFFAHLEHTPIPYLKELAIRLVGIGPEASARERMMAYGASNSKFRSALTTFEDGKWEIAWGLSSREIILEQGNRATRGGPLQSVQTDTAPFLSEKYDDFPWDRALQVVPEFRWMSSGHAAEWKRHHMLEGYTATCCWDLPASEVTAIPTTEP